MYRVIYSFFWRLSAINSIRSFTLFPKATRKGEGVSTAVTLDEFSLYCLVILCHSPFYCLLRCKMCYSFQVKYLYKRGPLLSEITV